MLSPRMGRSVAVLEDLSNATKDLVVASGAELLAILEKEFQRPSMLQFRLRDMTQHLKSYTGGRLLLHNHFSSSDRRNAHETRYHQVDEATLVLQSAFHEVYEIAYRKEPRALKEPMFATTFCATKKDEDLERFALTEVHEMLWFSSRLAEFDRASDRLLSTLSARENERGGLSDTGRELEVFARVALRGLLAQQRRFFLRIERVRAERVARFMVSLKGHVAAAMKEFAAKRAEAEHRSLGKKK